MRQDRMGGMAPIVVALAALALGAGPRAYAQHDMSQETGPPKYLYLSNAELKPGHSGEFAKLENEEIEAMRAAKIAGHYFGMWSITGNTGRVLFFHGFDSYADLQKVHDETVGNATVEAAVSKNNAAEGLISAMHHASIYEYQKDLSLNAPASLEDMRFMEIELFEVIPGQEGAFEHLAKEYKKAYESSLPEANWVIFQKALGEGSGTTYILVVPLKSLGDVDTMHANDKTFTDKTGPDLLALLRAQGTTIIKSEESDLFALGAKISYVPDKWLTDSPDFWGKK
ncbi:MAG: hypothetical protein RB191_20615 [Terriglobia bacterium]|nr:hypothetical protein [Terriglobia bacterium]